MMTQPGAHPGGSWKQCPQCGRPAHLQADHCAGCGHLYRISDPGLDRPPFHPAGLPPAPYQPYPAPPRSTLDPCAVLSTIFGALGVPLVCCFGWVFSVAGLILGVVSLARIHQQPELSGRPLAWIGIVLSALTLLVVLGFFLLALVGAAVSPPAPVPEATPI